MQFLNKIFIAALLLGLLSPFFVFADGLSISIPNPLTYDSFEELINRLIVFLLTVGIPVSTLMVMIGAFYLLTAAGKPERVEKGKNFILYAAIGLAILLFARGLTSLLKFMLGASN